MGSSLGIQGACSRVQRAHSLHRQQPQHPAAPADPLHQQQPQPPQSSSVCRSQQQQQQQQQQRLSSVSQDGDQADSEEEALVQAALEAVRARAKQATQEEQAGEVELVPEVASLGPLALVAVTGRMSTCMEKPFQDKGMAIKGLQQPEDLADVYLTGIRCQTGRVPAFPRPNQDDFFFVHTGDSRRICGVFDGHGREGHRAAAAARDALLRRLLEPAPAAKAGWLHAMFIDAFEEAHQKVTAGAGMDATLSGAAACVVVHDTRKRWLSVASVGNCRCHMGELRRIELDPDRELNNARAKDATRPKRFVLVPLSSDHTTARSDELARVAAAGAELRPSSQGPDELCAPGQRLPGIPLTRCVGNLIGHELGVIHVPEIVDRHFNTDGHQATLLLLATDGIWSVLKEAEVLTIIRESVEDDLQYTIELLIKQAQAKWEQRGFGEVVDDMTVLALRL